MDKIEVTDADRTLYHQLLSLGSVNLNRRRMGLPIVDGFELIAAHRLATRTDATPVARKQFPILGSRGAKIDLQLVEDHGKQAYSNHYQTVERLAERGGLSWCELHAVLNNRPWQKLDENTAIAECRAIEARYLGAFNPPATDVAALMENGCEMPEVAAMRYIEELRSDLAASVTILCDNEEAWTKDEQMAVEVIAEWTDWIAKRFMGESVIQCLARAIGARRQALAPFTKGQNDG